MARIIPALPLIIPFVLNYGNFLIDSSNYNLKGFLYNSTVITLFLIGIAQVIRIVSKVHESIVFSNEKKLPTTIFLLDSKNIISEESKKKVIKILENESKLKISKTKTQEDKILNIVESIRIVRAKHRDDESLKEYNILYGVTRNTLTSIYLSTIFYLANLSSAGSNLILNLSLTIFGIASFLFFKKILFYIGTFYAKELFSLLKTPSPKKKSPSA
ncbi:hypothetical protein [Leptospira kanakyensis]|uniref:hypothetical protein n=1 Tax=Leptospira kanakyensis TaxID=2484968 RepID=UPI00223E3D43|nr:hypothetical protein [Leptospira kanakyensis]MCW7483252.1 hypothetical protein [Leptospira kanakyensis]